MSNKVEVTVKVRAEPSDAGADKSGTGSFEARRLGLVSSMRTLGDVERTRIHSVLQKMK